MNKRIITAVVIIAVLGGVLLIMNNKSGTKQSTQTTASESTNTSNAAATIIYSDDGFSPSTTKVKSGDKVAVTNNSTSSLQFDSDPHPAHTDNAELNLGSVGKGKTGIFTVTKTGTFGFHNHFNSGDTGTIIVF